MRRKRRRKKNINKYFKRSIYEFQSMGVKGDRKKGIEDKNYEREREREGESRCLYNYIYNT